jgi:hypothetical protein
MPAFLEDYLHARFSGCGTLFRWAGGIEELLILEVKSLQRKILRSVALYSSVPEPGAWQNIHASACFCQ